MASEKSWRGKKKGKGHMNPRPRPQANLGLASSPEEPFGCILQKTLAFRGFLHYLLLPRCLAGGEGLSFLQQDIGVGGVLNSAWDDEFGLEGGQVLSTGVACSPQHARQAPHFWHRRTSMVVMMVGSLDAVWGDVVGWRPWCVAATR